MKTEDFIRESASRGLSRSAVRQALGVSRYSFEAMLEAMPPIEWPARGCSIDNKRASRERFKVFNKEHHNLAMAARREQCLYTLPDGRKGSIEELRVLLKSSISACSIRRRLAKGWNVIEAITAPRVRSVEQLKPHQKSGWI